MNYNVNEKGYYGDFGGLLFQKCYIQMWLNCVIII